MPDPITPTAPAEPDPKNPAAPPADATPPSPSDDKPVVPPKVDEKTVPYERFSQVNTELKAIKDKQAADEKKQLEEQGKWQERANTEQARADAAEARAREAAIQNNVYLEASKLGIVDADAASKLLNRTKVEVADDGTVTGVDDALKQLIVDKPYLVSKDGVTPRVGSGSSPAANPDSPSETTFKLSQIRDPKFYKEHQADIMKALKAGTIVDDTK